MAGKEQRAHKRVPPREIDITISQSTTGLFRILGPKSTNIATGMMDLSMGGARLTLNRNVPTGTHFKLILSGRKDLRTAVVPGTVVWLREHPVAPGEFIAGVAFEKMSGSTTQVLKTWIDLLG